MVHARIDSLVVHARNDSLIVHANIGFLMTHETVSPGFRKFTNEPCNCFVLAPSDLSGFHSLSVPYDLLLCNCVPCRLLHVGAAVGDG